MTEILRTTRELLAYTIWADRTILEALRPVSQADLTRETGTAFGSVLGTLAHMLASEQVWLARFLGSPPAEPAPAGQFPDRLALAMAFEELWSQMEFFVASLSEEQLASDLTWVDAAGAVQARPFRKAVLHLVNHSTFHRGQVVSLLRQMGHLAPPTDLLSFSAAG